MTSDRYKQIEEWTEDDLSNIPDQETDYYEYKSSKIGSDLSKLKTKIQIAASAFWNTGGGVFIAGVDDNGKVDGGIPESKGRTKIRDWADQILFDVKPLGPYAIKTITGKGQNSSINADHVVLVIGFGESSNLPHMGPEKKYYIRAGAHSVSAGHFLIEAIRARRGLHRPLLRGLLRRHERKSRVIELVILPVNEVPALNVTIHFDPLPKMFAENNELQKQYPLEIPIIDQKNPFRMDMASFGAVDEFLGVVPVYLLLEYCDVANRKFTDRQLIDYNRSISGLEITTSSSAAPPLEKTLKKISDEMRYIRQNLVNRLSKSEDEAE